MYGNPRDLHLRTHAVPTRRSSDLGVRQRLRFTQGVHRRAQSEFEKPGLGTAQQSFAHGIDDRCRVVEIHDPQPERLLRVPVDTVRSEEHTSELQSLMRISYAVFCLKTQHSHLHKCNIKNIK